MNKFFKQIYDCKLHIYVIKDKERKHYAACLFIPFPSTSILTIIKSMNSIDIISGSCNDVIDTSIRTVYNTVNITPMFYIDITMENTCGFEYVNTQHVAPIDKLVIMGSSCKAFIQ